MEEHFEIKVSNDQLTEAIVTYNETRRLLRELYDLRSAEAPPISGAETLEIIVASVAMPRQRYNELLRDLLEELRSRPGISEYRARLMVVGSVDDNPELLRLIEDVGGLVVADSLCFGARFFWDLEDEGGDAFESITERYYRHIPCPRMYGEHRRTIGFVRQAAREARVDGVILQAMKFCDLHGIENVLLERDLEADGIPTLKLEREYGPLADTGRFRTRVQAFLERIGR